MKYCKIALGVACGLALGIPAGMKLGKAVKDFMSFDGVFDVSEKSAGPYGPGNEMPRIDYIVSSGRITKKSAYEK